MVWCYENRYLSLTAWETMRVWLEGVHDGYKNTYTFVKDGKKVKLLAIRLKDL